MKYFVLRCSYWAAHFAVNGNGMTDSQHRRPLQAFPNSKPCSGRRFCPRHSLHSKEASSSLACRDASNCVSLPVLLLQLPKQPLPLHSFAGRAELVGCVKATLRARRRVTDLSCPAVKDADRQGSRVPAKVCEKMPVC